MTITITTIESDDWTWMFVSQDLVYEGYASISYDIREALIKGLKDYVNVTWQFGWLNSDVSERACSNIEQLMDFGFIDGWHLDDEIDVDVVT